MSEGFENIDRRLKELGPVEPDRFSLEEANARLNVLAQSRGGFSRECPGRGGMHETGRPRTTPRGDDDRKSGTAMETLGLTLSEGKAMLAGVQDVVVAHQIQEHLARYRVCPHCQCRYTTKDSCATLVGTVFGHVEVPNPRWNRCPCQTSGPDTFRPIRTWLNEQTRPEMRTKVLHDELDATFRR